MMRIPGRVLLLVLSAAGCGGIPTGGDTDLPPDTDFPLTITALATMAAPGAAVPFRIENAATVDVNFNLCGHVGFEHRVGSHWVALPQLAVPCAFLQRAVNAGQTVQEAIGVPADAPRGTYRLRIDFESPSDNRQIVRRSTLFQVD